jgi:hypothetical protein
MPEETKVTRILARVRALSPKDWLGKAGKRFKKTATAISDFAEEHEVVDKAADLGFKAIKGKAEAEYSTALKNYSEEERNKVDTELKRRTIESSAREAEATAKKSESEARVAQIREMEARLALFDNLKARNAIPIWDDEGNMTVVRVGKNFDWDTLQDRFLSTGELPKLTEATDKNKVEEPAE